MKKILISFVVLTILISACSKQKEYDKTKMAHLYVDILIAGESYKHNIDSLKIVTDSLYSYYQISDEEYKRGIEKFNYSEETWDEFFKLSEEYLDTLKVMEERRIAKEKEEENTKELE